MQLMGILIMAMGTFGIIYSTVMEIKFREPIYSVMMKIFPLIFAIGAIIFALTK